MALHSCQVSVEAQVPHSASVVILGEFQLPTEPSLTLGLVVSLPMDSGESPDSPPWTPGGEEGREGGYGGADFPHGLHQHCKGCVFVTAKQR